MQTIKIQEAGVSKKISQDSPSKRLVAGIVLSTAIALSPSVFAGTGNSQSTGVRLMTDAHKIDTRNIDSLFEAMISKDSLRISLDHITLIQLANRLRVAVHAGTVTSDQAKKALDFFARQEQRNLNPSIPILAQVSGTV
jgi:hypothetical protein